MIDETPDQLGYYLDTDKVWEECATCGGTGFEKYGLDLIVLCGTCDGACLIEHRCR